MAERPLAIERFLAGHGFAGAARLPLAGDASARRYERLVGGPRAAVLMDMPPGLLDLLPFLRVGRRLREWGLSAPEVLAADAGLGLALLEDLGDRSFSRALEEGSDAALLYGAAVDLLVGLQGRPPPDDLPVYDDAWLLREAMLLVEWYAGELDAGAVAGFEQIWQDLLPRARIGGDCLVYVDYHADNLMWLPERHGDARVGLLDFQDARKGPPAYDLVSLLEDARRDVDPALADGMIGCYLAARPEFDPTAFRAAYAILGAQRNSKILGLFSRLARRDGKPRYLALQPRVRAHLQRDLAHPATMPLRAWFARHLPLQVAP
jgi:aminoglycoside/choline kinase family phosphotransferase